MREKDDIEKEFEVASLSYRREKDEMIEEIHRLGEEKDELEANEPTETLNENRLREDMR